MATADTSGAKAAPILTCRNVWKVYGSDPDSYFAGTDPVSNPAALAARMREEGHIPACANVSFDVKAGEIFVIMGLSGSGKSTIVRCLSRLVEPTQGEVIFEGRDLLSVSPRELIDLRRHKIGMVFQNFGLMPHLNVIDNVAFPLKLQGLSLSDRRTRAERVIELVGLDGREAYFPRELSGGQQQRVGIARSLAVEPELWLLDEPFSALDPLIRRQMQDEFLRLQQVLKKSIVFITHDFLEALRIADRMAIMRDGQVVQIGTPADLIINPADDYVAEFSRDVPVARVLTARDALVEGVKPAKAVPANTVPATMTVETLLPMLATHPEGLGVSGANGAVLGFVTAESVVAALAHEAHKQETQAVAPQEA